ncbi:MAG: DUF262 domain-containing HNH endonuclease family protein [Deltaproteobacteria bacterium]|nr:DUF262 domain-containing HNH endonuclease family protein [Deltaproteobacteria bacterium]
MQAKETKLQDIIEGTKQYVIPLFQRTYSWTNKEWEILWKDLIELCEAENPRTHFIGSLVNMPTVSVPEGVAKFLLIDGQQRLTTIFVLLILLRNKAQEQKKQDFAEEINNTLLVNPYKKDNDFFNWHPMQTALNESLTEYIRHYLMRDGSIIKQNDVYYALKEKVTTTNAIEYLKDLQRFSVYYQRLIYPEFEPDEDLQKYFRRLNRIEVTTAYPLLLNFYGNYTANKISKADFVTFLKTLENYLIRRFVCNVPSNQLNKIFPTVYPLLETRHQDNHAEGVKTILQSKGYPKDAEFYKRFKETKFYGAGDRQIKTKLILETLEESFSHKEAVPFDNLTIEHIMPQTLSEWWQNHLGEDWEDTHELFLHTIGNLTLTAYNTELSNDDFTTKQKTYNDSHLELNKYFSPLSSWTRTEIEKRAEALAKQALNFWNYFGQESTATSDLEKVTGTSPTGLKILGQQFEVKTWRDVLEQTLNTVADLEPDKFEIIAQNFPRYLGKDKNKFRAIRQLQNGFFLEVNLSAQNIQKFCSQAMETIELTSDDWSVMVG